MKCKHCGSEDTIKHGIVKLLKGDCQKYKCQNCRRTFIVLLENQEEHHG